MISDIFEERIKGIRYSKEPWRPILLNNSQAIFRGRHQNHTLLFVNGAWQCDCDAWKRLSAAQLGTWCRHTIALQRILIALNNGTALVCQAELAR